MVLTLLERVQGTLGMGQSLRILIIEDSDGDASRLLNELRRGGYEPICHRVDTADGMRIVLAGQSWDLVRVDASLPEFAGAAALNLFKKSGLDAPLFLIAVKAAQKKGSIQPPGQPVQIAKSRLREFLPVVQRKIRALKHRPTRKPRTTESPVRECGDEPRTALPQSHRDKSMVRGKQTEKMLRYLAQYDPLTSLPNRNLFNERFQQAIQSAQQNQTSFALMIMGLDRFRDINHTLGPKNADLLLKQVAQRFKAAITLYSTKARLGGDEFAAIFPEISEGDMKGVCANVLGMLESPFMVNDMPIDLSASIGVAFFPQHSDDGNMLFQRANIALDMAKQSRQGYAVYREANDPYSQQRLAYLGGLRNAIEQDHLVLHFQPKIDLQFGRTNGVEALVRWNHPQMGLIAPYQFIAVAERTGLIHALSYWVLRRALERCCVWRELGLDIPVAVNLSPRNLHDRHLPEHIARLLEEYHLPPEYLEVEITENVIMTEAVHVLEVLTRLSQMGVRTYIDDFGTGYSSLGHLKKLPVAGIKIDKSFVSQLTLDENDAVIVRSTIDLGHNLGLKVVAEGVESSETWDRLRSLGCDATQGYYMSRPKPAHELERWFAESPWGIRKSVNPRQPG